jgi:hypothetical protein
MAGEYDAIAAASGLSPEERKKIERLNKALATHKTLLNLPQNVATEAANRLPTAQRKDLAQTFGTEAPEEKPNRGWLGTAWHYTGYQAFKGLTAVSDFMTRLPRTAQIAVEEDISLQDAWNESGKDGEKKFNEKRLADARQKYGNVAVNVAMRIASGEKPEEIMATATEEEKYYLRIADKTITEIPGMTDPRNLDAARDLFDDTISAVNAAKYSPGRWFANTIDSFVPGDFYENGFFYKLTSGAVDALYRFRTDPFLLAGKAKRTYDLNKYSLEVVLGSAAKGGQKLDNYFNMPTVQNFWNSYGEKLDNLRKAAQKGNRLEAANIRKELARMAPEFGPGVIKLFEKSDVTDAEKAKAFFLNSRDTFEAFKGVAGRRRIILPKLDAARKLRIKAATTANRIFNIDEIGPRLMDDAFFGQPATDDGILKTIKDMTPEEIAKKLADGNRKDFARFSMNRIWRNINAMKDSAKRKFTPIPMFRNDQFDLMADDAGEKMYRLAAVVFPTREARLVSETFQGMEDVGARYELFLGLWDQITGIRGANLDTSGNLINRVLRRKGNTMFSLNRTDEFATKPVLPSEMNTVVSAPSLADLEALTSRNLLYKMTLGLGNSKPGEYITSLWSFLTLAGPRYAIRNAGEDLMVNLAIGNSIWGITKGRYLSTRINTAFKQAADVEGFEKWASNPLGIALRIVNNKDHKKYIEKYAQLETDIVTNREELTRLRGIMSETKDPKVIQELSPKIVELENKLQGGIVEQTRRVLAEALTQGRLYRFTRRLGLKPISDDEIDLLTDQIIFGDIENLFSVVSEGGFNFASGADYIESAMDLVKSTGARQGELRLDIDAVRKNYSVAANRLGFRAIGLTTESEASLISYLLRVSFYSNDELGSIAVANLADDVAGESAAIQKIFDWLKTDKGQKLMKEARLSTEENIDELRYAQIVYNRAKEIFTRRDNGQLNTELLDKIRVFDPVKQETIVSGKIGLDDLPDDENLLPAAFVGPELVPIAEAGNVTSSFMKNGWVWLGLSNARMSRQPLAILETLNIRKSMRESGFEEAYIAKFTSGINPAQVTRYDEAVRNGKRELAKIVEERAVNNILAYVDNPLVRSQVAFSSRNFARFYRAQEDFYRRLYRLVRYNPASIQRLALTFDGVAHSGWIQEDDRGELYFVYPHFTPAYKAIQGVMKVLGVEQDFKVPFPVQFGGAVKMLTPSLNPDSLFPTFAGPAAALPVSLLENVVNIFEPGMGDKITRVALGEYAVDASISSRLLPAHVNRVIDAMDQDERNSQYASAYRKAVTYLEATGNGIPQKLDEDGNLIPPTAQELEEYRQKIRSVTLGILATRFVYGFVAPAAPRVELKSEMAEWIRDAGKANWKQAWNGLLQQYNGDYDEAMRKWVELYPNQVPYTVAESDRKTVAFFGYAEESNKFVTENEALFQKYPEAAAFLIPHKGAFSFDAYKTMTDMGLLRKKRVEDYLQDVQTAADERVYYEKRDEYENNLKLAPTDSARAFVRAQFNTWKSQYLAGRPLLAKELSESSERAVQRTAALSDLERMLDDNSVAGIRSDVQGVMREMLQAYLYYRNQKDIYSRIGGNDELIDAIKISARERIKELAVYNENTQAAYDGLFARLLDD